MEDEGKENPIIEQPKSQEEKEVQRLLNQIFIRCGRLVEQAETVFPKSRLTSDTDEKRIKEYGTAKTPMPSYVFIYTDGKENTIHGDRTKKIGDKVQRTDEFWQISFAFELGLSDRLSLKSSLPKEVALNMEKMEDGTIKANIKDFSPGAMKKILAGRVLNYFDVNRSPARAKVVLAKCVAMISESPAKVTDYMRKDLRNFSSPQVQSF